MISRSLSTGTSRGFVNSSNANSLGFESPSNYRNDKPPQDTLNRRDSSRNVFSPESENRFPARRKIKFFPTSFQHTRADAFFSRFGATVDIQAGELLTIRTRWPIRRDVKLPPEKRAIYVPMRAFTHEEIHPNDNGKSTYSIHRRTRDSPLPSLIKLIKTFVIPR